MTQLEHIKKLKSQIYDIAHKHNAVKVYVFGSCARGEENINSDIDFLADFNTDASLFDFMDIQDELEKLFNCKIDIVSSRGLNPYIRESIMAEAVAI